jgi:hypothetical protein
MKKILIVIALAITTNVAVAYEDKIGTNVWPQPMQTSFVTACVNRVGMDPNIRAVYKFTQVMDTCRCVKDYLMYNYGENEIKSRMSSYNQTFGGEVQQATVSCLTVLGYSKKNSSDRT